jgi:hypothetical protein
MRAVLRKKQLAPLSEWSKTISASDQSRILATLTADYLTGFVSSIIGEIAETFADQEVSLSNAVVFALAQVCHSAVPAVSTAEFSVMFEAEPEPAVELPIAVASHALFGPMW